jgi:hypothetical protein
LTRKPFIQKKLKDSAFGDPFMESKVEEYAQRNTYGRLPICDFYENPPLPPPKKKTSKKVKPRKS